MPAQVTFDHYELLTRSDGSPYELGRGAMGITYKAFDTNLRIPVALKVINGPGLQNDVARDRFVQEARAAARLRHRHVASVFHLGVEGENYFYAMEFIDGETVECLVKRRGPLPELISLRIALQVSRALHAAEQHGLVHRDIKPSNLMLVQEDDELCAKVIDFGLVKNRLTEEEIPARAASTTSNGFVGTPHYASPEQLEEKEIDSRSDIYSLGATLWFMLSGEPPFGGSIASVVSQHLTAEPPFAQLDGCSPTLLALLGKMLEKDPARRFQTATELRSEIESCIEAVAGGPAAAVVRLALEEARVTSPSAEGDECDQFTVGGTVAERYQILATLGSTNTGWLYHARDLAADLEVRLVLLDQSFNEDRAALTGLEEEIVELQAIEHPNLLRVYGMETVGSRVLLVMEWAPGVTLLQVLRTRRELEADEVLRLLEPMAYGADHIAELSLKRLELSLHQVYIHFPGFSGDYEALLRSRLEHWPEWVLKLNPVAVTRELAQSQTWAGGQTLVGGAAALSDSSLASGERSYTRELAVLVYELLGGTMTPLVAAKASAQGLTRVAPLSNLTEEGNGVLRRALDPAKPFPQARLFYRSLANLGGLAAHNPETSPPEAPPRPESTVKARGPEPGRSQYPLPTQPVGAPRGRRRLVPIAVGVVCVGLAIGAYFVMEHGKPGGVAEGPTSAPNPGQGETSDTTTPPSIGDSHRPAATPTNTRRDLLLTATSQAEQVEAQGNEDATLEAWLKVAEDFPETLVGRMRLEVLLDAVRSRAKPATEAELLAMEPILRQAAKLDVVSAEMLLGEMLRETKPEESFKWFSAAADKGVPTALTQVGLMLANGTGVERNLPRAIALFQEASEKGESGAMAALGELYLYGRGVEKDLEKAIKLLEQAAARSNARALNRLGTCYHKGIGVRQNFEEARKYFTKAEEKGSGEALGNLAVLYMKGDGVQKDPRKALEYIQRGADSEDAYSMFLLAICLEDGTGIPAKPAEARNWFIKATRLGIRPALEWCQMHKIYPPYVPR